jgi:hypothetical protein
MMEARSAYEEGITLITPFAVRYPDKFGKDLGRLQINLSKLPVGP